MTQRPNIVFLLSDQHGGEYLSCAGKPDIRTPHMDRLAAEGVHFPRAYTPCPLCAPARVAMLTGRYPHSTGIMHNGNRRLPAEEPTLPQALQRAGYHTVHIGKTHLAQGPHPGAPGFDERLQAMGFSEVHGHNGKVFCGVPGPEETDRDCEYRRYLKDKGVFEPFHEDYVRRFRELPHYHHAPSVLSEEDYHDAYIARRTAQWIADYQGDAPFYVACNWGGPHSPWDAPGRYARMYDPAELSDPIQDSGEQWPRAIQQRMSRTTAGMPAEAVKACKAHYYGMINVVDDGIGAILRSLEECGLLENTLVIYASDHGEMMYDHGLESKMLPFEGSVRVPLLLRYPAALPAGRRSDSVANLLDLVPTLTDLAQAAPMRCPHGRSMMPELRGEVQRYQGVTFSEQGADVSGDGRQHPNEGCWKLVHEGDWKYAYSPYWDRPMLINLAHDPHELHNLAGDPEYTDVQRRLHDQLLNFFFETEYAPR
jgi:choline-sulfatase